MCAAQNGADDLSGDAAGEPLPESLASLAAHWVSPTHSPWVCEHSIVLVVRYDALVSATLMNLQQQDDAASGVDSSTVFLGGAPHAATIPIHAAATIVIDRFPMVNWYHDCPSRA